MYYTTVRDHQEKQEAKEGCTDLCQNSWNLVQHWGIDHRADAQSGIWSSKGRLGGGAFQTLDGCGDEGLPVRSAHKEMPLRTWVPALGFAEIAVHEGVPLFRGGICHGTWYWHYRDYLIECLPYRDLTPSINSRLQPLENNQDFSHTTRFPPEVWQSPTTLAVAW